MRSRRWAPQTLTVGVSGPHVGAAADLSPSMPATHAGATARGPRCAPPVSTLRPQSTQRESDLTPDDHVVALHPADPEVRVAEDTRARLQAAAAEVRGH